MTTTKVKKIARELMNENPGTPYKTALGMAYASNPKGLGRVNKKYGLETVLQYGKLVGSLGEKFVTNYEGPSQITGYLVSNGETFAGILLDSGEFGPFREDFPSQEEFEEARDHIEIPDAADAFLKSDISNLRYIGLYQDPENTSNKAWREFVEAVSQEFIPSSYGDLITEDQMEAEGAGNLIWFPVQGLEAGARVLEKVAKFL